MSSHKPNISLKALIAGFTTVLATLSLTTYSEDDTLPEVDRSSFLKDVNDTHSKNVQKLNKIDRLNSIEESDLSFLYKIKTIFDE